MYMTKMPVKKYPKIGWIVKQKQPNLMFIVNKKLGLEESNHMLKQQKYLFEKQPKILLFQIMLFFLCDPEGSDLGNPIWSVNMLLKSTLHKNVLWCASTKQMIISGTPLHWVELKYSS